MAARPLLAGLVLLLAASHAQARAEKQHNEEAEPEALKTMPPLPGLRRVVVLARHGNRAPNNPIHALCPPYAKEVLPKFGVAPGQLSRVGMSENWESGVFLRKRYEELIGKGAFTYDGKVKFFSERADRNIVSTIAMSHGMYPSGTGMRGYSEDDPNIIPIPTTQEGADVMMNCPRDGPCIPNLSKDLADYIGSRQGEVYRENEELFTTVAKACGVNITAQGLHGKPVLKVAKIINDAFTFAEGEGLDPTIGGRIDFATIKEFKTLVNGVFTDANFGKPHQLTYWASDFLPTLLSLGEIPLKEKKNLLHVFLNHRELLYASARILQLPIQFPGQGEGSFPTGSLMGMEVYDEGVRLFYWGPTVPPHKDKAEALEKGTPMRELFTEGTVIPVAPPGCEPGKLCPLKVLQDIYIRHVEKTGTWAEICGVHKGSLRFEPQERSLGIESGWLANSKVGGSLFANEEQFAQLPPPKLMGLAGAVVLVAGVIGFICGKQSSAVSARERDSEAPYVTLG